MMTTAEPTSVVAEMLAVGGMPGTPSRRISQRDHAPHQCGHIFSPIDRYTLSREWEGDMAKKPTTKSQTVYGLMMGIKRKGKRRATQIYPKEFTRFEIAAIGVMTIHWAYLEHMMLIASLELVEDAGISMPDDVASISFERRVDAFRAIIKETLNDSKRRRALLALATRISNVHNDRNMVTHGLWEWYPGKPTKLRLYTFRPPFKFDTNFDLTRLANLCNRLGEINHELTHPPKAGLQRMKRRDNYMSREFSIIMSGEDPAKFGIAIPGLPSPHSPQPSPAAARRMG
jgi:hypothetical protein